MGTEYETKIAGREILGLRTYPSLRSMHVVGEQKYMPIRLVYLSSIQLTLLLHSNVPKNMDA